jgi:serine/threonine protein kinase/tetratricopeptide (TPR) repeat protein
VSDVLDRLKSALADRYSIERELGSGGMATVYLAEDLKHHRKVAVKVLRPELATALGPDRFLREIQLTAQLNHPHILPLLDSGEADGFLYYVMPYVAGESLRGRLERETQLPVDEALRITRQVASALEFAHRQDVIHRDIKPENILLHEGEAMVADFGIALAVSAAGGERLTETGVSVGTAEYMSPEQALGEGEPDARSDVYSLGCVLYEMLVDEPPYTGPTAMAVLAKRLSDPVPRARRLRAAIPEPVDAALVRALARERVDRFGSAREFAEALEAEAGEGVEAVKSIVVLPFTNLSPDPENEYFSDGLTEEIITDLSKIRALRVISRNSAMQLKGTDKDTKTIGRELGVQYVLEGSVRKAGNRLRITAQLIDAQDDVHCWADRYDGVLEDVFDMQEKVSRSIVDALMLELSPEEERRLAERPIDNAQAYECYLRARQEIWLFTKDASDRARQHLQNGLDIIGENALLLAGMGYVYAQYANIGVEHEEYIEKAEEYARKALELDPESAEAHIVLGFTHMWFRGDQRKSFYHLKQALARKADDPHALLYLVVGHTLVGRVDEAYPLAERLARVDPLTPLSVFWATVLEVWGGRFDVPSEELTKWFRLEPQNPAALGGCAGLLAYCSRYDEARELIRGNVPTGLEDVFTRETLLLQHALDGEPARLRELVTEDFERTAWRDPQFSYFVADCHALAGLKEEALDWLSNAVDRGFINYPFIAEHDPLLASIRGEPRFRDIAARAKYEWEHFEV